MTCTDYDMALTIYDRLSEEDKLKFKHYVMTTWPHLNKDVLSADYIIETMIVGVKE